jgi:hypothetical protein
MHMRIAYCLAGVALAALPTAAFGAGFAQQSIFLSKSSVVEGETVLIHTVVQNDLAAKFPGQLVVRDGETRVGAVPVELDPGEAQAVSVSWKPGAGSRTIVAELQDKAGTVVESESATFSIKARPKPVAPKATTTQVAAAVESSDSIQNKINDLSPAAGGAVAPFFRLVDGSRSSIADVLDSQLAKTKPKVAQNPLPGVVAGAQSETPQTPEPTSWFWSIIYTVYFYILTVARFIVGSAGIFYPLLAVLFFFTLWRTYRRFRRN